MRRKVGVITGWWPMARHFVSDTKLHDSLGIEVALVIRIKPSTTFVDRARAFATRLKRRARINETTFFAQVFHHYAYAWTRRSGAKRGGRRAGEPELDPNIRAIRVPSANDPAAAAAFRESGCELGLVMSCDVISRGTIHAFDAPLYNVHMSDPAFVRGRPAVFWEIHGNRDSIHLTLHRVTPELDAGPIVVQREVPIAWAETIGATIRGTIDRGAREIPMLMDEGLRRVFDGTVQPRSGVPGPLRTSPTISDILQARRVCRQRGTRN